MANGLFNFTNPKKSQKNSKKIGFLACFRKKIKKSAKKFPKVKLKGSKSHFSL